ncbi:hypothetical protein [Aliikangiella coralliicola]|uniref:Uncharacterized protein n=1 Tax=Aliikangiella coralliicola TaxID=2592383 RepID=A0A545UDP1_9GAMM|nr:hypothetical protein [Aliikangiella coralliicola]TQV87578.1 hypothetical protein FLL46_11950 [Aliikangiella coralliicola]
MSIFITILGHVLTLLGAITGIFGETYDPKKKRKIKLTRLGWTAAIVASLGISLTIYKSVDDYLTSKVYEEIALKDIKTGWRQVASIFFLLEWEVKGEKSKVSINAIKNIRDSGMLAKFDQVNFKNKTKVIQYAEWNLGQLACKQTSMGMRIMESAVRANDERISRDIAEKVQKLRQSPVFGKLLAAGCGTTVERKPNYELFKGMFNTEEMKSYLSLLIELGNELGNPGKK